MQTTKNKVVHPIISRVSPASKRHLKQVESYTDGFAKSLDDLETFDFEYHLRMFPTFDQIRKS